MAETVLVDGRRTARPGAYSEINGSGLARRGPGIKKLYLIGEAEGGKPGAVLTGGLPSFLNVSTPQRVKESFRAGLLRVAGLAAFDASGDSRVNGPASIEFYKVNPATQSSATFNNAVGAALDALSRDYGAHTARISVAIALGTAKGYALNIVLEDLVEAADNVGGDPSFDARYDAAGDFATARCVVDATGVKVNFAAQMAADATADPHTSGEFAKVSSASAYDTVQSVTVYGETVGNVPTKETIALAGAAPQTGAVAFGRITGAVLNGATRGDITIASSGGLATPYTIPATLTADHDSGEEAEVVSTSAADTATVVVSGYTQGGTPITENIALTGIVAVAGLKQFGKITQARLLSASAGTVTVRSKTGESEAFTIAPGALSAGVNVEKGLHFFDKAAFSGILRFKHAANPGAGTHIIIIRGRSTSGVEVAERLVLVEPAAWVSTTTAWASIEHIEIGEAKDAIAIDLDGAALDLPKANFPYVKQVVDAINAAPGFFATAQADGAATFSVERLDHADNAIKGANAVNFLADLDAILLWINANSALISATRASGATGAPIAAATFLVGGIEGTTTTAHWQAAFDALKRKRNAIVVPLSTNAAIHAISAAHNRYMEGKGGDERNSYLPQALTLDRGGLKAAIRAINDRNSCAIAQSVDLYSEDGVRTTYGPEVLAAMAGAMQGGSGVGEPLTWKGLNAISVAQNTDWGPDEDADEMIQMGLMFARADEVRGLLWERSVTTWRNDDNPVFTEMSANESANESVKRLRQNLGLVIGEKAFAGRASTLKSMAEAELELQVSEGIIKAFASVSVRDLGASFEVEYQLAAIEPTNFIVIKANLARIPSSAAA